MTRDVKSATPETPLIEIADILEEHHIKRVPIITKGGDLVGIVSRANIIQAIAGAGPSLEISLPDAAIRTRLLKDLRRQPWAHVHRLNITVTNGVVDLWGSVQSEAEREAIAVAAEAIPGVTSVKDHLMHDTDLFTKPILFKRTDTEQTLVNSRGRKPTPIEAGQQPIIIPS